MRPFAAVALFAGLTGCVTVTVEETSLPPEVGFWQEAEASSGIALGGLAPILTRSLRDKAGQVTEESYFETVPGVRGSDRLVVRRSGRGPAVAGTRASERFQLSEAGVEDLTEIMTPGAVPVSAIDRTPRSNTLGQYFFKMVHYPAGAYCALAWQITDRRAGEKISIQYRRCGQTPDVDALLKPFDTLSGGSGFYF